MAGKPIYRITNWDRWHTVSQSQRVKTLSWVPLMFRGNERETRRLLACRHGGDAFAAYTLMVTVAATMPTRGLLEDGGGPLDADDLAVSTGGQLALFERGIPVLIEQGWITPLQRNQQGRLVAYEPTDAGLWSAPSTLGARSEHDQPPSEHSPSKNTGGSPYPPQQGVFTADAPSVIGARPEHGPSPLGDRGDETETERRGEEIRREETSPVDVGGGGPSGGSGGTGGGAGVDSVSVQSAGADFSGSDSGPPVAAEPPAGLAAPGPRPPETDEQRAARLFAERRRVWFKFQGNLAPLWARGQNAQRLADATSTERLFDRYVWPRDEEAAPDDYAQRMNRIAELARQAARQGEKPMAWLTKVVQREFGDVPGEVPA